MLAENSVLIKIERKILIISLIFSFILYIITRVNYGVHPANSFLFGAGTSVFDIYALSGLLRKVLVSGAGWLFVPLSVFRWGLAGFIVFYAFYFYKAEPIPLVIGISIPFACVFLVTIYNLLRGHKNGASS